MMTDGCSQPVCQYLETEVAEDMRTVGNAVRMCRPISTHHALFICTVRTLLIGYELTSGTPQQIPDEEVLYFPEVYQRQ